jgi:hypothetical protein
MARKGDEDAVARPVVPDPEAAEQVTGRQLQIFFSDNVW